MSIAPTFGEAYPAGRWLPLRIDLRNDSANAVDGVVRMPIALPGAATEFRFPTTVPPKSRLATTVFAYLPEAPIAQPGAARKSGANPVAVAEWIGGDGARLARAEVLGSPDTQKPDGTGDAAAPPGFLLLSVNGNEAVDPRESFQVVRLAELLSSQNAFPLTTGHVYPDSLPRHVAGYGSVKAVILSRVSPAALDESQRQALKAYLLVGGVLVLPAPIGESDPTATWMDEMLPVSIIGSHEANAIAAVDVETVNPASQEKAREIQLRETIEVCEAVNSGGEVLLKDEHYAHVSFKRVGLGRVVFLSVPVNALDPADPRTALIWREILQLDHSTSDWAASRLQSERDHVLESMIGAPTPRWSNAAIIAGGYLGLMLMIQLVFSGARRPVAFAVGTGVAILGCGVLLAISSVRRSDHGSFSAARLATIDLGVQGGGVRREAIAFFGRDDPAFSLSAGDAVALRPVAASADNPASVTQLPFAAPNAAVRSGRVDRVWEATEPVAENVRFTARATFESDRVMLQFDNRLGSVLRSPIVIWNRACYRTGDLPQGSSAAALGLRSPAGDFTNASVIAGEADILRSQIAKASVTMATNSRIPAVDDSQPMLIGWLDASTSDLAKPMTQFSVAPDLIRAQVMVRSPIQITPSALEQSIHVPSDLVQVAGGAGQGVFYDDVQREWVQSMQAGNWLIGFRAPAGIGSIRPTRATLRADLLAPGHKITFRRGQALEGVAKENTGGPIVAEWNRLVGARSIAFDLDPADADAQGCVWLLLSVEEAGSAGDGGVLAQWKFGRLEMELDARVESRR